MIVTAEFGPDDLARLDALRQRYFPPERNWLRAHLTMFHALPPSMEEEARRVLAECARQGLPTARLGEAYLLGRGVALRVLSPDLEIIRETIANRFHGVLTSQDRQGWRPHVTIQNKVDPAEAKRTLAEVQRSHEERPLKISGLALHRYAGGPWEPVARYSFRG